MYEFVRGPLLWASAAICFSGFIYRAIMLFRLTQKKDSAPCPVTSAKSTPVSFISAEERKLDQIARFQNSVLFRHPVMIIVSTVFHFCLFATPLLLMAHNQMLSRSTGISLPSIPDGLADLMTILVLCGALFFLMRRIALPRVAAISSMTDYGVLLLTVMPFLTGFLAYHQLLNYTIMMTMHVLAGDLLLIALPFTKVGHMVFFFFTRLTIAGEYSLGRGSRTWST
ncbi:MAG: hypothetical protein WCP86_01270 [bacterium]